MSVLPRRSRYSPAAGLAAIEAYHSSHDAQLEAHYLAVAARYDLAVTGGSDYHGEGVRRAEFFGVINLPQPHFDALLARAGRTIDMTVHA